MTEIHAKAVISIRVRSDLLDEAKRVESEWVDGGVTEGETLRRQLKSVVQQRLCKDCSDAFGCVEPCVRYLAELEHVQAEEKRRSSPHV